MPIKFDYNLISNVVHSQPYDSISAAEVKAHFNELINNDDIKDGFIFVADFKNIKDIPYSSSEAYRLVKSYTELKDRKKVRALIFIGDSDPKFGMSRMLQILHELENDTDTVFAVRNAEEAEAIIKKLTG